MNPEINNLLSHSTNDFINTNNIEGPFYFTTFNCHAKSRKENLSLA
jgi:hypothetical protein